MLFDDDSDDEFHLLATIIEEEEMENEDRTSHRPGSILGHAVIQLDRVQGNDRLYRNYFADTPTFGPHLFRRRFRMNRPLFFRIQHVVEAYDPYFVQRREACKLVGLSSLQKNSATFRMLAYGVPADFVDEYVWIDESNAIESLKKIVKTIIAVFGDKYLRSPNNNDIIRLLEIHSNRGFPGMLGSIDCMHWKWKNCPVVCQGSLNDINVLKQSTVFKDLVEGRGPHINYSINGHEYIMRSYLADESARKDVERAFEVLQSRFVIMCGPACFWDQETLNDIMKAYIIMHNMIIEDEKYGCQPDSNYDVIEENQPVHVSHERTSELYEFIQTHHQIRDRQTHFQLQTDFVEHLWQKHGVN